MAGSELAIDLHLVLRDGARILMGVRRNTGFCDGMYHLPAGRLEEHETIAAGAIREAKEELGIDIQPADLARSYDAPSIRPAGALLRGQEVVGRGRQCRAGQV